MKTCGITFLFKVIAPSYFVLVLVFRLGGGRGFIGRHLCDILNKTGYDVTIISRTNAPVMVGWGELPSITWVGLL